MLTVPYIVKSVTILAFLLAYYQLFLRKQTFFTLNRLYLLSMLTLSASISFIHITLPERSGLIYTQTIHHAAILLKEISVQSNRVSFQESVVNTIYILGVILLTVRYLCGLCRMVKLYRTHPHKQAGCLHIIRLTQQYPTFSFFNYLFLNNQNLPQEARRKIAGHEKIHSRELHSIDLVLAELICILNWFNPLVWVAKKFISENHEYITDQKMLRNCQQGEYMELLVSQTFKQRFLCGNRFSCSNLKKRIFMMGQKSSHPCKLLNYLPVLPLTCILFLIFTCNIERISAESVECTPFHKNYVITAADDLNRKNRDQKMQVNLIAIESTNSKGKALSGNEEKVYVTVQRPPDFSQGSLTEWLTNHLTYPAEARGKKIDGKTYVNFIVEKDGSINQVKVTRSSGHSILDKEALRVVGSMPNWTPGEENGKTIRVSLTLPVNFQID